MKNTTKCLSDFRSLDINREEIMLIRATDPFNFQRTRHGLIKHWVQSVSFYGSLQIMDGLFIMN